MRTRRRTALPILLAVLASGVFAAAPRATGSAHAPLVFAGPRLTVEFPWGQCTYWAARKRPEIVRTALAQGIDGDFNGAGWVDIARQAGFPISSRPSVGSIAVWPALVDGASPAGHVAYVVRVNADGSFVVSEMNFNGNPYVHVRRVAPLSLIRFIGRPGTL